MIDSVFVEIVLSSILAIASSHVAVYNVIRVFRLRREHLRAVISRIGLISFTFGMALLPFVLWPSFVLTTLGLILMGWAVRVEEARRLTTLQMILSSPFYNVPTFFHAVYTMLTIHFLNGVRENVVFRDWAVENYYKASAWLFVLQHAFLLMFYDRGLVVSLTHVTAWTVALYPSIVVHEYTKRWL